MPATPAETDPSVCYRHPDRSSWTLCARCGRTICPECQILTPSGVRCPDCVRETGGSVRWEPSGGSRPAKAKKAGMRRSASTVGQTISATTYPVVTIAIAATALVLWVVSIVAGNVPYDLLSARSDVAWQVWRYVTAAVAYPGIPQAVLFILLSIAIFVFIGWGAEKQFGRRRYLELVLITSAGSAAIAVLAGGGASGLMGAIWGITGAYLIVIWQNAPARNRLLISIAIWLVISIFLGGNLLAIIGGTLSGVGAMLLLRRYDDRRSRPWVPHLILAGAILFLALLAVVRNLGVVPLAS